VTHAGTRIGIVGAGMAGLACATRLVEAGHAVTLFDKGRGAGGRMSTRRVETPLGEVAFDHGAQYFTVRDPGFAAQVAHWQVAGLVAPWPAAGADAWVGVPGMNAPLAAMARQVDVRFGSHVMGILRQVGQWWIALDDGARHGPFDALIVAVPAEQAAALLGLHDLAMASGAVAARSQPCWTAMMAFDQPLPSAAPIIQAQDALQWAARNSAKPGRGAGETWVVQASPAWSVRHLEDAAADVAQALAAALLTAVVPGGAGPRPTYLAAHRWRYARVPRSDRTCAWNAALQLGACGDWLLGPRVEQAWLSGIALARTIGYQQPVGAP